MARLVLIVLGIWLLLGIFMGMQLFLNGAPGGQQVSLVPSIGMALQRYSIYAVLTFPVLWLCRRFPLTSKRWIVPLSAHVAGLVEVVAITHPEALALRRLVERNLGVRGGRAAIREQRFQAGRDLGSWLAGERSHGQNPITRSGA
jgi:hypothetical protein